MQLAPRTNRACTPGQRGFTLMEVMLAITLLAAISAGMLVSLRGGLLTLERTSSRIEQERRALGVEEMLRMQLGDVMPSVGFCGPPPGGVRESIFRGTPQAMLLTTSYSMTEGSRGYPRIVSYQVLGNADGTVRLVVNEALFSGPVSTAPFCQPAGLLNFWPQGAQSFVVAARLASCRILYRQRFFSGAPGDWKPDWNLPNLPYAIRIEMIPPPGVIGTGPSNITIPFHVFRDVSEVYADLQ
ncbi:MAG: prepilin-type N-terminal cleavage/methylation domain-containing protein [Acidobacteriota bacterium]